jgi:hypothetical protein
MKNKKEKKWIKIDLFVFFLYFAFSIYFLFLCCFAFCLEKNQNKIKVKKIEKTE